MHPLGGVSLLLWNTIQQTKAAGYEALDLGAAIRATKAWLPSRSIGAESVPTSGMALPESSAFSPRHLAQKIAQEIVKVTPDRVLVAAGNLLYRHIG